MWSLIWLTSVALALRKDRNRSRAVFSPGESSSLPTRDRIWLSVMSLMARVDVGSIGRQALNCNISPSSSLRST
jgi:hypothetical protein